MSYGSYILNKNREEEQNGNGSTRCSAEPVSKSNLRSMADGVPNISSDGPE